MGRAAGMPLSAAHAGLRRTLRQMNTLLSFISDSALFV